MANELHITYPGSLSLYAMVRLQSDGSVWNVAASAWAAWNDADIGDYDIPLASLGGDLYAADFPAGIAVGTEIIAVYYEQAGGSPALDDALIGRETGSWSGTAITGGGVGSYLISVAEAKELEQLASASSLVLIAIIGEASAAITRYCGRDFLSASYTETYDGDGTVELLLDHYPVISLTSVTIKDDDDVEYPILTTDFRIKPALGLIRFKPSPANTCFTHFPAGFQNVAVAYSAGYATAPDDVKRACKITVAEWYGQGTRDPAMASESLGDYAYTAKPATARAMPDEALALLAPHRSPKVA